MKKYLPIIGIAVFLIAVVVFFFARSSGNVTATLTPSDDNHWLKLNVKGINSVADRMEYELIYDLPDGRVQGVPGSIDLEGESNLERDILLGTESSGIYYYDEGVEKGTISLRFYSDGDNKLEEYETNWVLEDLKSNPKVF